MQANPYTAGAFNRAVPARPLLPMRQDLLRNGHVEAGRTGLTVT
jgi:hypothetical protein